MFRGRRHVTLLHSGARQSLRDARSLVLPILRAGLGIILIAHGCQKLFGLFGGMGLTATQRFSRARL